MLVLSLTPSLTLVFISFRYEISLYLGFLEIHSVTLTPALGSMDWWIFFIVMVFGVWGGPRTSFPLKITPPPQIFFLLRVIGWLFEWCISWGFSPSPLGYHYKMLVFVSNKLMSSLYNLCS